jgi:hypothetical protein
MPTRLAANEKYIDPQSLTWDLCWGSPKHLVFARLVVVLDCFKPELEDKRRHGVKASHFVSVSAPGLPPKRLIA